MAQNSKVNLKKINNKDLESKNGEMALSIVDITLMEWNMGKVSLLGLTKVFTKETFSKMKWKAMVFRVGLMVDATPVAGKAVWWTVLANFYLLMDEGTKVNIKTM